MIGQILTVSSVNIKGISSLRFVNILLFSFRNPNVLAKDVVLIDSKVNVFLRVNRGTGRLTLPDPVKIQDIDSPQMDPRSKASSPSPDVDTAAQVCMIAANTACTVAALAFAVAADVAATPRTSSSRESNRDSRQRNSHFASRSLSTWRVLLCSAKLVMMMMIVVVAGAAAVAFAIAHPFYPSEDSLCDRYRKYSEQWAVPRLDSTHWAAAD